MNKLIFLYKSRTVRTIAAIIVWNILTQIKGLEELKPYQPYVTITLSMLAAYLRINPSTEQTLSGKVIRK